MTPKYLYMVYGMGAGHSLQNVLVEIREIARETPRRWYCRERGVEVWFMKRGWLYTDWDKMVADLRKEKARRLDEARRVVHNLEGEITAKIRDIPTERPQYIPEDHGSKLKL